MYQYTLDNLTSVISNEEIDESHTKILVISSIFRQSNMRYGYDKLPLEDRDTLNHSCTSSA